MSKKDRKQERLATGGLSVRFSTAEEFVTEYAENLSAGGLFVRAAHTLEPLSEVQVEIDLPGYQLFQVRARVAHVLDEDAAARYNRSPGAGLQLVDVPPGFEAALMGYLGRLGRRRDSLVLAEDHTCQERLEAAGFRTALTNMGSAIEQVLGAEGLLAIVVNRESAAAFRDALAVSPVSAPVIGCSCKSDEEPLLVELDRLLEQRLVG